MKNITMKKLIESSNIPAKLIRSTVKQCDGWNHFKEYAADVARHGASGGTFGGFVYYDDTCAFYRRNKRLILDFAESQSSEMGFKSLLEMIMSFGDVKRDKYTQNEILNALYANKGDSVDQIQNLMAWYACEEVCRAYVDLLGQED